jgi:hypothetical protein
VKKAAKRTRAKRATKRRKPLTFDDVREIGLALPGVQELPMYGTPALKVNGKGIVRLREDGDLALWATFEERDFLLRNQPDVFFLTDHYRNYPVVLVRLSAVDRDLLHELLIGAWRHRAPKRLVAAYDASSR